VIREWVSEEVRSAVRPSLRAGLTQLSLDEGHFVREDVVGLLELERVIGEVSPETEGLVVDRSVELEVGSEDDAEGADRKAGGQEEAAGLEEQRVSLTGLPEVSERDFSVSVHVQLLHGDVHEFLETFLDAESVQNLALPQTAAQKHEQLLPLQRPVSADVVDGVAELDLLTQLTAHEHREPNQPFQRVNLQLLGN